ncbi:unnamed protein product, partial [Rotaria magnacalcarata]
MNSNSEQLENRPRLVNFSGRKLTDATIESMVKDKTIHAHCTQLNLSSNNLTCYGCWVIANALRTNTTLTQLNLSENQISQDGAKYLADVLYENTALMQLNLGSNQIKDGGVQCLADALQQNT